MGVWCLAVLAACPLLVWGSNGDTLGERSARYLTALLRIDSTNPDGHETRVARYLKQLADEEGIDSILVGGDPERLNFVARLTGSGKKRPLLLMAHSDVVPADRAQWSVDPFSGALRDGYLYGRGAQDDKSLLAAELAVMVEVKRQGLKLERDLILLSEADEEAGSTGIQWLIRHGWEHIKAEFALNEGGFLMDSGGVRVFQVQTGEKVPTRAVLTTRGTAGHGSLPLPDNPVVRLARAVACLADYDQPVRLNRTTRQYLAAISNLDEYRWLAPLLPRLDRKETAVAAANEIRERDPELNTQLRTTVSPTVLTAGYKVNVIPNVAVAQIDIRRLPNESREEVMARIRQAIKDDNVEVSAAPGQEMPATEPSSTGTALYKVMERVFQASAPRTLVVPYMQRGATDGSYLRQKGMAVYGIPLFLRDDRDSRAHGNDERISLRSLAMGTNLLWQVVLEAAR